MGHSVCVRGKKGVKGSALCNHPIGLRVSTAVWVDVELEEGAKLEDVTAEIKANPYFATR